MKLSFILSAHHTNPTMLLCALTSIQCQTHRDIEIILTNNATNPDRVRDNVAALAASKMFGSVDVTYITTYGPTCYHSAEVGASIAKGDYVCFPSADSYYVPKFAERMLHYADATGWDLIYCDMVYDERYHGHYEKVDVQPIRDKIDKTGFILRRSKMIPFPHKPDSDRPAGSDGFIIEELVASGVSHGKVPELLLVHN